MSESRQLLDQFLAQAWDAADAFCRAAAGNGPLPGLQPDPAFTTPPFKDRVLQQIDSLAFGDPVAAASFGLLRALVPNAIAPTDPMRLHGWEPGDGGPRTVALLMQPPSGVPCTVALVFVPAPDGSSTLRVIAQASAPTGGIFKASSSLSVNLQAAITGTLECEFRRGGSRVLDGSPGGTIGVRLFRHDEAPVSIGLAEGPSLTLHGLVTDVEVQAVPGNPTPVVSSAIDTAHVDLKVLPRNVGDLLGGSAVPRIALAVSANADGLQFASRFGGGTRSSAANLAPAGGLTIDHAGLELRSAGSPSAPLQLGITVGVTGRAPGLPVAISADGVGTAFGFSVGRGGVFGFRPSEIVPLPPSGIGAELTLPFARGSGFLIETRDGGFAGEFDLDLGFVGVRALALLQPGRNGGPLSLAVLISVQFPYPGIQLGLGFSLNGVGGLVAINRRTDLTALQGAVLDGSVGALLAPAPASTSPMAALATLGRIFPEAPGHFVIGPMLHLGWGGRLITMSVALIFDLPDPPTLAILGRVTIAIPDPAAPLIRISLTFLGGFDPSVPKTFFLGTLEGSHMLGVPIQGDAFILVSGGRNSALVISAGGFHPEYARPAGTPALRRLAFDICPLPIPRLRAEMYFALTSNSVQFGAGVYLSATIAGCGVEGRFVFDALCVFAPDFMFVAQCSARVAVEALGQTLIGVSLDVRLQGPSPWQIRARGSVSILWEDISLELEAGWGEPPPRISHAFDVEGELRKAFLEPRAWMPDTIGADRSGVNVRRAAKGRPAALHPLGRLQVRQRLVPCNVVIQRYQGIPIDGQRWTMVGGSLSDQDGPSPFAADLRDDFARAQYFELSEGDQLGSRGFTSEQSGGVLVTSDPTAGRVIESPDDTFDEKIIPAPGEAEPPRSRQRGVTRMPHRSPYVELLAAARDIHLQAAWWRDDGRRAVAVTPIQRLAVATVDTMQPKPLEESLAGRSAVEASQILNAAVAKGTLGVQLVEAWEFQRRNI